MKKDPSIIALFLGHFPIKKPLSPYIVMQAQLSHGWENYMPTPILRIAARRLEIFFSDSSTIDNTVRAAAVEFFLRIVIVCNNRTPYRVKWFTPDVASGKPANDSWPDFSFIRQPISWKIIKRAELLQIFWKDKVPVAKSAITSPRQSEPEILKNVPLQSEIENSNEMDRTYKQKVAIGPWRSNRITTHPRHFRA